MRRFGRALAILLLAPLLIMGSGFVAAQAPGGKSWIERQLERQIPGLSVEGLSGSFPSRLTAERMTLSDAQGPWLVIRDAVVELRLRSLFGGTLRLTSLEAEQLTLMRLPEAQAPAAPPQAPAQAPGILPQLPDLPIDIQLDRLSVERLEIEEPVAGEKAVLTVRGAATLAGGELTADLQARRLETDSRLELVLDLRPAADRLEARVTLQEPPGGLLARVLGLPDRPASLELNLDGPATGAQLRLSAQLGADVTLTTEGTVRAGTDGAMGAALQGEMAAAPLLPQDVAAAATPLAFALNAELSAARRLAVERVRVTAPAAEVIASGAADLASGALNLRTELTLQGSERFGALVPADLRWDALRATAQIGGTIPEPAITLDAGAEGFGSAIEAIAGALGPSPHLSLAVRLPGQVERLQMTGTAATLQAAGRIAEPLDLSAQLQVSELSALRPDLAGAVEAEVRITGALADPTLVLEAAGQRIVIAGEALESPSLTARVVTPMSSPSVEARMETRYADLPVRLIVDGAPEGTLLRLRRAEAQFGPVQLTAQGTLDPSAPLFMGEVRLEAPELTPFSSLAGTPLNGSLHFAADLSRAEGNLQGFDARLEVPALEIAGTAAKGTLTARGTPDAAQFTLDGEAAQAAVQAAGQVEGVPDGRQVALRSFRLRYAEEMVQLAAPARATLLADGAVRVDAFALTLGRGGTLRATGRWGPEQADLRVILQDLPAGAATAFAAPDTPLEGIVSGEARITGPVAAPEVRAEIAGRNLRVAAPWARGVPAAELRARASVTGTSNAQFEASLVAGQALRLNAAARLPRGFGAEAPLTATLDGRANLAPLADPFLAASGDRASGALALAFRADGTLSAPRFGGQATLANGSYRNPVYGVSLTEIAATLRAEGTRLILERLTARTPGNGRIAANGALDPGTTGMPLELSIAAQNARPVQSDQYSVRLDADLRLAGELLQALNLSGLVAIDRAEIRIPEQMPRSVRTLPDVQERGRGPNTVPVAATSEAPTDQSAQGPLPPISLDLILRAPREVFVRGRGVDAEFGGELGIGGTLSAPRMSGEMRLRRGTFRILDRRLQFDRGILSFGAGTLVPTLDFEAVTQAREVTITIGVRGTPEQPEVTFSSVPELPQDEILARLLFDRAARDLSPLQIVQLSQALAGAVGLQTPSAGGILDRIRRTFALDRLTVESEPSREPRRGEARRDGDAPAVEAGRYVAEGVYVGVQQGTEGGPPRVGVEIDLLPRLRLEAESGNARQGDRIGLTYEFEY